MKSQKMTTFDRINEGKLTVAMFTGLDLENEWERELATLELTGLRLL
jgi:hypothetical protein